MDRMKLHNQTALIMVHQRPGKVSIQRPDSPYQCAIQTYNDRVGCSRAVEPGLKSAALPDSTQRSCVWCQLPEMSGRRAEAIPGHGETLIMYPLGLMVKHTGLNIIVSSYALPPKARRSSRTSSASQDVRPGGSVLRLQSYPRLHCKTEPNSTVVQ